MQYELMAVTVPDFFTALTESKRAWHTSGALSYLSLVQFCSVNQCGTSRPNDGRTVILKTVFPTSTSQSNNNILDCGPSIACVKATDGSWADADGYMNNMELRIEQPPKRYNSRTRKNEEFIWTLNPKLHFVEHPVVGHNRFFYLPLALMHELGHSLGLRDLGDKGGYLMGSLDDGELYTAIPDKDVDYLSDVYRNHTAQALPATTEPRPRH